MNVKAAVTPLRHADTASSKSGNHNLENLLTRLKEDDTPDEQPNALIENDSTYDLNTVSSPADGVLQQQEQNLQQVTGNHLNPNTHRLSTMTFNTHSIRHKFRRDTLFHHIVTCPHDIVAITETWCTRRFPPLPKRIRLLQSPPRKARGE